MIEPPPCYSEPMPRRCGPGQDEYDAAGNRLCWAFTIEQVPNRGEREYNRAFGAWAAAIEAACVRPAREVGVDAP